MRKIRISLEREELQEVNLLRPLRMHCRIRNLSLTCLWTSMEMKQTVMGNMELCFMLFLEELGCH